MAETAGRLLRLLSLLQDSHARTGADLADRLGVTDRTLRADIHRLRELGYPIHAARGAVGGYRLGSGATMPPLLLDDEEAVAVAVSVGLAEDGSTGIADVAESAARALAKLDQVMPKRLRRKVAALRRATAIGPAVTGSVEPDAPVEAAVLDTIAAAIRDTTTLRVPAEVEPYRLVSWQRRWYLVAYDLGEHRWRALPVAGFASVAKGSRVFAARTPPQDDLVGFVLREIASAGWLVHARVTVLAPADVVIARINPTVGVVEPVDDHTCVLITGADTLETIAIYVGLLGMDFRVDGPPGLVAHLRVLGERYLAALP